ncbi:type II toxin-antitoxin system HicB family antitoxin [Acinetobacter johnsonii]|uniref:type II toxin-antitoxin system HicB family antitoxin n=1 Tax=Acinetobacter johnsonii TaxID=40214 RepID=UPI00244BF52C|nr:type II toxin-antitoxin system HicB family antitoxin [Acinetobacter johnsonii]MDH1712746.1 type II toxin-antitoxin system HicB family antitoxin [Acinetobacter johnsonii]MDQ8975243.1 type II toxin-antitoxin system HicB family antitoxin [Acinetobacter johnsonii]
MVCHPVFYPAKFEQEGQAYNVSFRDIPEAMTCGDNFDDALQMAKDALFTSVDFYLEEGRTLPPPSECQEGEILIALVLALT